MKLIFLDIDGTLTPAGSNTPPESALEAIRAAQAAGHKVFLCTGRNMDMLKPVLQYSFDGVVASSGGYVTSGEQVIYDCPMTDAECSKAMRLFQECGAYRTVEALDGSYCDDGLAEFLNQTSGGNSELVRWRKALEKNLGIRPMSEYDGRPIYKIVFMCRTEDQIAPVRDAMGDAFSIVVQDMAGANCINGEFISKQFDKGSGIRQIAEALGVSMEDTVGFGDSMNDLEMIQVVGKSVCMANGSPRLQAISDLICPSVEEDGLAWGFRELGLL